jgi:hypothetical protein
MTTEYEALKVTIDRFTDLLKDPQTKQRLTNKTKDEKAKMKAIIDGHRNILEAKLKKYVEEEDNNDKP